ncbi:hypothetical protein LA062_005484, partial [Escherichia coli]|nr:hypothetical protein [Escherichia coli]
PDRTTGRDPPQRREARFAKRRCSLHPGVFLPGCQENNKTESNQSSRKKKNSSRNNNNIISNRQMTGMKRQKHTAEHPRNERGGA